MLSVVQFDLAGNFNYCIIEDLINNSFNTFALGVSEHRFRSRLFFPPVLENLWV